MGAMLAPTNDTLLLLHLAVAAPIIFGFNVFCVNLFLPIILSVEKYEMLNMRKIEADQTSGARAHSVKCKHTIYDLYQDNITESLLSLILVQAFFCPIATVFENLR